MTMNERCDESGFVIGGLVVEDSLKRRFKHFDWILVMQDHSIQEHSSFHQLPANFDSLESCKTGIKEFKYYEKQIF